MTTDTKVIIGVIVATVGIIIGAGLYTNRNAAQTGEVGPSVDQPERLSQEDDPVLGAQDAKVTVVEFGDFQCPACGSLHPLLKQLKEEYADQSVKFVFRHFPLTQLHEHAQLSAEAAVEAQKQGKFWEYHDKMFESQPALTRADLEKYAQELGLNMEAFRTALDEHTHRDVVAADVADGRALGIRGTPTLFINDQHYTGSYSATALKSSIDSALQQ
ncbi:MAG: DsbA family protein [Candidatus Andersenbacteria bacterium]|nr:DsbA family protein [Candidatus Andersenbacteria bacterium]MBI3250926.1 DsbA family protein [Candidatus Andersenbacteria bacterium]